MNKPARSSARLGLAAIALAASVAAQSSLNKSLRLEILRFTSTSFGFEVLVSVKNIGDHPVVLATAPGFGLRSDELQHLGIEQWDEKLGWQPVGPCRDAVAGTTMTLGPGQSIQTTVPIGDKAHGWNSTVCPRKIEHLQGKVRAVLYFAYHTKAEFRKGYPKGRVDIYSPSVDLPAAD